MADISDYDFTGADPGASKTYNMEAGQIRVGGHMCIKGFPCKVTSVSTSKTGKHGSAKCNFTAIDIFTGKKYEDIQPSTANVEIPNIVRREYGLIDISADDYVSLMDNETGEVREDIKLPEFPEGYGHKIKQMFETGKPYICTVLKAMGHEQIMEPLKEDVESAK